MNNLDIFSVSTALLAIRTAITTSPHMQSGWDLAFAAQAGAKREELHATVTQAMNGWPS
jgi:hypothetical protein